ncbi:MAG: class I mannose-6-phosphate isomerase [Endomicrobium sp.]|nr:class I mannose-6-phosphate isomerase [Endomicrobium sp.]
MTKLYNFKPIFFKKMWGVESWILSGNDMANCIGTEKNNGEVISLKDLWKNIKIKSMRDDFPLLLKIITPIQNLSIQVHPDDRYAKKMEGCKGKDEFWYVLNNKNNMKIINGHSAISKNEFIKYVNNDNIEQIVSYETVKKGDCIQINAGTVHSLGKGVEVLEVQQSNSVTYRIYDYKRIDTEKCRDLNLKCGLKAINYPSVHNSIINSNKLLNGFKSIILEKNNQYTVKFYSLYGNNCEKIRLNTFCVIYVLEGEGFINSNNLHKSECVLVMFEEDQYITIGGQIKFLLIYCPN